MKKDKLEDIFIYGKHAVMEALAHAPHTIKRVHCSERFNEPEVRELLRAHKIEPHIMNAGLLDREVGKDTAHQGILAKISTQALMQPLDQVLKKMDMKKNPCIVILGGLYDPHNVGAVIRSAAAFGVSAVLIPERNQSPVTGTVVKTSAGMAFRIPLVAIGNVNETLRHLKERGFWTYGLAMKGNPLSREKFDRPAVFVLGNEGHGIREKTLDLCDIPLTIAMDPRCESLNAAAAAAVVLYQWSVRPV
ncbi:MAG: 23S rRNA (guanosine(2251)-2'-O)-methyltransferase RlmB [Patescibacteria group bacterium]